MKILHTSDWHSRYDVPACRLESQEEWQDFQIKIYTIIFELAIKYNAYLTIGGDIFDSSQQPIYWINRVADLINNFDIEIDIILGNHDLPYHNMENEHRSAAGNLLRQIDTISYPIIDKYNFNEKVNKTKYARIILEHLLVTEDSDFLPGSMTAEQYIENRIQDYDVALIGDYHHSYAFKKNNKLVLNPGCITIQSINMIDYIPKVILFDSDTYSYEFIELDAGDKFITDKHRMKIKERDSRIDKLVSSLKKSKKVSLSFKDNVEKALKINKLDQGIIDVIEEVLEEA